MKYEMGLGGGDRNGGNESVDYSCDSFCCGYFYQRGSGKRKCKCYSCGGGSPTVCCSIQ